jgi:hypothetical protein
MSSLFSPFLDDSAGITPLVDLLAEIIHRQVLKWSLTDVVASVTLRWWWWCLGTP